MGEGKSLIKRVGAVGAPIALTRARRVKFGNNISLPNGRTIEFSDLGEENVRNGGPRYLVAVDDGRIGRVKRFVTDNRDEALAQQREYYNTEIGKVRRVRRRTNR